eukprot:scaffold194930_cov35-Cyclotella_meneghiniana.AAC.2
MIQTEARHKANIKVINSRHAARLESMKESLKKTNLELSEVTDMSMHVAEECFQLKNSSDAEVHQSTKQAERSDALSKARLEKLKKSKEKEVKLRETLDSTTEAFEVQLAKAHAEIGVLTELLADSNCEIDELQEALVQAREELAVSDAFHFSYQLHALTPKLLPQKLKPHIVQKKKGQWDEVVTQLVVELLSHRTPPLSICPNILSVVELLMPNSDIIKELPGNRFVRYCRTILAQVSQTLAAYNIAVADTIEQSHTDGTSVRQTAMQNFVVRATKDGVEKKITLSSCILSETESAESIASAILQEFNHARSLIKQWKDATTKLYPGRDDLQDLIPSVSRLCISRLVGLKSFATTDTCATARKLRRILNESIKQIALEKGLSEEEVMVFEADCWQHLRKVWFGGVSSALSEHMREVLADDLIELPTIYRINLDIDDLFRCIDKEFSKTANYAKGHGSEFFWWMQEFHPDAYLFPVIRALGGTRQDLCVEAAPAVLMNLPYYLQYLHWRIEATGGSFDNIL